MSPPLVSIVTVNYNNASITCDLIASLKKASYPKLEIIVVDNNSKESTAQIENEYPDIMLIKNSINKGFAGGNNDGIKASKGDYIFLLNNDTEVPADFLESLIEIMEKDAKIGALSPKICYFSHPDTIQFAGGLGINLYTGRGRFRGKNKKDNGKYNECIEIENGHGAALLLSRKAIEKIGLIYEGYFLYYEELDYCAMLKKAGFKILYAGCSVIYHKESMSIGKTSPLKTYYLTKNRLLYIKRNSKAKEYIIALTFFFLFALPKNSIYFILKGKPESLKATLKGVRDYFKNH